MEKLMQFVWEHRLGLRQDMRTVGGQRVRVVDQGILNNDAGPDFFNATVEIGDETWAGNVEIHVRASDWFRHGHDKDPAYDSVILHVVRYDDMPVHRSDGSLIPQLVMHCSPQAASRCNMLVASAQGALPCASVVKELPSVFRTEWLAALGAGRLCRKSERVLEIVSDTGGHWEGAAYITFARALGFGLNSEPFELLARSVPLPFLNRHADNLQAVEAILFGQAGLLPAPAGDEEPYLTSLRQEYEFLAHKFSLRQSNPSWKMARTRPQNFPHRRIAMLARFIHAGFYLTGALADADGLDTMRRIFEVNLTGFWATHFTFGSNSRASSPRALSRGSVDSLLINVAIPLLHARAMAHDDLNAMEQCVQMMHAIPGEANSIVRLFENAAIECTDAFTSQALIELRREFCEKKKCIYCRWGQRMLSAEIQRP